MNVRITWVKAIGIGCLVLAVNVLTPDLEAWRRVVACAALAAAIGLLAEDWMEDMRK